MMSAIASNSRLSRPSKLLGTIRLGIMSVPACFAVFAGALLVARTPGYQLTPSTSFICLAVTGIIVLNCLIHACTYHLWDQQANLFSKIVWFTPSIITFEALILVTHNAANDRIVGLTWLILFTCETIWWIIPLRTIQDPAAREQPTTGKLLSQDEGAHRHLHPVTIASQSVPATLINQTESEVGTSCVLAREATQTWTRYEDETGESIAAIERILFQPGQRHQAIHFCFVPSLPAIPTINTTIMEGPRARIQIGNAQSFGARLEIKLSQTYEDPVELIIQIEVIAQRPVAA